MNVNNCISTRSTKDTSLTNAPSSPSPFFSFASKTISKKNKQNQIPLSQNSGIAPSELTPALVEAFEREARASAVTKRSAQNAVGGGLSWDE